MTDIKITDKMKSIYRNHNLDNSLHDDEPDRYIYFGLFSLFLIVLMAAIALVLPLFL